MPLHPATPPFNVYEANGQLSVAVPIPGSHPEHVRITVAPTALQLHADCKYPQESQHYHHRDWQVGSWELKAELPSPIDPESARATLNYGVLVVMARISDAAGGTRELGVG